MFELIQKEMETVIRMWENMKYSTGDEISDDADRFQKEFYALFELVYSLVAELENPLQDVEEAQAHPEFKKIFEMLPDPLRIPFEMELDRILMGQERAVDCTEQG
ncbi:hypothetical protein [Sulfoacidibacillus thermotolerans]|uniref:Uncharacterized protein n=1 Tax=Sulfoacidibacillus thermotolerans TaxID=1765684 RepID=A0A2U3D8Y5_SULT2|nr:hypothetical protein [Sulfoacidibacillus thermotolerans]PWI57739.1 hypothetical protein BM613_07065 [Sulfoacidibacillus thermotolerans]